MLSKEDREKLIRWMEKLPDRALPGAGSMCCDCVMSPDGICESHELAKNTDQTVNELRRFGEILDAIEELRAEEGDQLTIICNNPDFTGYNSAVDCCGEWTSWIERRFRGDNLPDCLRKAVAARRNVKGEST